MKNFDYEKKYHYGIKYLIIGFPVIILLLSSISEFSLFEFLLNELYDFFRILTDLPLNRWYFTLISMLGFDIGDGKINTILLSLPLYIFWVYVLDLILDVFTFIPKLAHKLMKKLGV